MRRFIIVFLLLAGCDSPPVHPLNVKVNTLVETKVWSVTVEAVFDDDTSYCGKRKILRFKHADGKEYIGVTGVGVSEVGAHKSGKTNVIDER